MLKLSNVQGNTIGIKSITPQPISKFKNLLAKASKLAKESGLKKADINKAIKETRKEQKQKILNS